MVRSRFATAAVGVLASFLASALLWWYTGNLLFFLFVPLVPFLFCGSVEPVHTCPVCDFRTQNPGYESCPRDGHRLE